MTFNELSKAVKRETRTGATEEQIKTILVCAVRMCVEELLADRVFANVNFQGIGIFTLKRTVIETKLGQKNNKKKKVDTWKVIFKQSSLLKKVVNDKMDVTDLTVGGNYLYPNLHETTSKYKVNPNLRRKKVPPPKNPLEKPVPVTYTDTMMSFRADARTKKLKEKQIEAEAKARKEKKRNYSQLIPDEDE